MSEHHSGRVTLCLAACVALLSACATGSSGSASRTGRLITTTGGFVAPEAVRYDPEQDVYFVGNWGGDGNPGKADNNGYISRMRSSGTIEKLRFIAGGEGGVTLHSPRGMYIVGDTLWVADFDAVRGFDRRTGATLATVDFTTIDRSFLNDVAADATGAIYVTDTGKNRVYRVRGGPTLVVADTALAGPNGITWDSANNRFLIVPYNGGHVVHAFTPGSAALASVATSPVTKLDGVELLSGGRILVSSQQDSSLYILQGGSSQRLMHISGPPADIAVDTRRNRVAVPSVARNSVEIWELPQ